MGGPGPGLGRPCSQAAAEKALSYATERAASFDPQRAVWAFIERVSSGLFLFRLGHRQEARPYLAVADRLSRTRYSTP